MSSIAQWASEKPEFVVLLLQKAELCRTNNFDLLGNGGYASLCEELAADFPYLTAADLAATVKLGIKGELDKYKSLPLNFTRIYQWVKLRAPYSLGYWQQRFPEVMAWAELCVVGEAVRAGLVEMHEKEPVNLSSALFCVREQVASRHGPGLSARLSPNPNAEAEQRALRHIESVLWPKFVDKYPAFAAKTAKLY